MPTQSIHAHLDRILQTLQNVKQTGQDRWMASCPCHDDRNPSLRITAKDGKLLVKCHAGCDQATVWKRVLELAGLDGYTTYRKNGKNGHSENERGHARNGDSSSTNGGKPRPEVREPEQTPPQETIPQQAETEPVAQVEQVSQAEPVEQSEDEGITLAQLAEEKHLPVEFLQALGVEGYVDKSRKPRVRIPYYDHEGTEIATRLRMNLRGPQRFKWTRGSKPTLYGLWKLHEAQEAGFVVIVEGESDCWTLWFAGIPAVGVPGKTLWKTAFKDYLQGLKVYIWQEPDAQEFGIRIGQDLPDAFIIRANGTPFKDPSDAFVALGLERFKVWMQEQLDRAEPVADIIRRLRDEEIAYLHERVKPLLEHPDPLELVKQELASLYAGDYTPALVTYLSATTRLLPAGRGNMPAHLLLWGSPSAGKSAAINAALELMPEEAYVRYDAATSRVVVYTDADLRHRAVIMSEADSIPRGTENPAASVMRSFLQEGRLIYECVVQAADGSFRTERIQKEGPSVLITSSTVRLEAQLDSRMFSFPVRDDAGQISAAINAICEAQTTRDHRTVNEMLVDYQRYLQLLAPIEVTIPWAPAFAKCLPQSAVSTRILRDLQKLFSLVKAVAILRGHREATIDDYREVWRLAGDMYQASAEGVSEQVRQVVEAVHQLRAEHGEEATVTINSVAKLLGFHYEVAKRYVQRALNKRWLINRGGKGEVHDLVIGEPLPDEVQLPTPEQVEAAWKGNPEPPDGEGTHLIHRSIHIDPHPIQARSILIHRDPRVAEGYMHDTPPAQEMDGVGDVLIPPKGVDHVDRSGSGVDRV
ncbi:MAG: hypothetical protein KatS3mg022_3675 [Armatimonadota bacterium]|nr:MAG: hypothetical protein KatS3mg022_3675 [Armatimonadota bacterium]